MTNEDAKKVKEYELNRHLVSVKTDKHGNWYFEDANGNIAQRYHISSGTMVFAKHDKQVDPKPNLIVNVYGNENLEYEEIPDDEFEESPTIIMATINDMPVIKAQNYTADMYEVLFQRERIIESVKVATKTCEGIKSMIEDQLAVANITGSSKKINTTESIKKFIEFLQPFKVYFATYFSLSEHKFLRALISNSLSQVIPSSLKNTVNPETFTTTYLNEIAQIRTQMANSENKSESEYLQISEQVAQNKGSTLSFSNVAIFNRDNTKTM